MREKIEYVEPEPAYVVEKREPHRFGRSELILTALILATALALMFWLPYVQFADDGWFAEVRTRPDFTPIGWVLHNFHDWQSRLLFQLIIPQAVHHVLAWRIITALSYAIIAIVPVHFIASNTYERARLLPLSAIAAAMLPVAVIFETGMIVTPINYLWPLAAGLIAVIPAIRIVKGERVPIWLMVVAWLGWIYAATAEPASVLLFAVYLYAFIVSGRVKALIPFLVLTFAAILFHLLTPGNAARTAEQIESLFPSYGELSLFRRIEMGYAITLRSIFMQGHAVVLVFLILLAVALYIRASSTWQIVLGAIPAIGVALLGFINWPGFASVPQQFYTSVGQYGIIDTSNPITIFIWLVLTALLIIILLDIYFLFGNTSTTLILVLLLAFGFASRAILGFSPSIWASAERPVTYLLFAFGLASLILLHRVFRNLEFTKSVSRA